MDSTVGSVAGLWRFPVKSMLGERLNDAAVTSGGLVGDRTFALIDLETGKVVSAKSAKRFPDMFKCLATFVKPPQAADAIPPVRISLPNGTTVYSDSPTVDSELSAFFGRDVTLATAAPPDFTIDQYHPDVEDADPAGHRDTVVESKLGSALFAQLGMESAVPVGSFFDMFPVSVLTTSTLDCLNEIRPESRFDERRFRMNVIVDTDAQGFLENEWLGRQLAIGDVVRVVIAIPDPRCVMTTLAQEDLPKDSDVLRTLAKHNRLDLGGGALYPCAGVYAVVATPGTVRVGDPVAVD
jgi:uncharacterized protein